MMSVDSAKWLIFLASTQSLIVPTIFVKIADGFSLGKMIDTPTASQKWLMVVYSFGKMVDSHIASTTWLIVAWLIVVASAKWLIVIYSFGKTVGSPSFGKMADSSSFG